MKKKKTETAPKEQKQTESKRIRTEIFMPDGIPKLVNPVLIEGLPGIGFVGKLAAEHMVEELKAKKVAELYSHHFPHQILINKDGSIKMLNNEIHIYKDPNKRNDLIILIGDVQPMTPEAQYEVMNVILNFAQDNGVKRIMTLGGYGVGRVADKTRIFGAVTDKKDIEMYKKHGIQFGIAEGSIIGAAGMLLGLGKMREMNGICIMGETHGNYIDHKAAQKIIEVLSSLLGFKISTDKLEKKAKESEDLIKKMEEESRKGEAPVSGMLEMPKKPEELSYIR